jgi:ribose transport system permease protein
MKTRGQFFRMNRLMSYSVMKPLLALVIMICIMTFLSDNFATSENFFNVLRQVSVNLCISVGRTLVILTGGIDLSVGSVLAISGAVAAGLFKYGLEW